MPEQPQPKLQSLVLSEGKGKRLSFRIYIPPNLPTVAPRDKIMVRLEAVVDGNACAPEKLNRGNAYWLEAGHFVVAALVESWCEGKLHGILQLTRDKLSMLLTPLVGEPVFFLANKTDAPIPWEEDRLRGVSDLLVKQPVVSREKAEGRRQESEGRRRETGDGRQERTRASHDSGEPMLVDGSTNFIAIQLPSRESVVYHEARALVEAWSFTLEPSNRKWWLRNRDKALNFLAEHKHDLEDYFRARFTDNFKERAGKATFAKLKTEVAENAGDCMLDIKLDTGGVDDGAIRRALAQGRSYVEDGERVVLLEKATVDKLAKATAALSGQVDRPFAPSFSKRVAVSAMADAESILEELEINFEPPETWRARGGALRKTDALEPAPVSGEVRAKLRPYQQIGAAWLWHLYRHRLGGILADEMGLGKTVQALALLACVQEVEPVAPLLVVCPASLMENWRREAVKWAGQLQPKIHHGGKREKDTESFAASGGLIITSYGTLSRDSELFSKVTFGCVIADEAQHVKNRQTQNARALRSLKAKGRFVLTGTPVENSLDDLRSLFDFLMPGYLVKVQGSLKRDEREWYDARLRQQAAPYILRRTKKLVAPELPEKIEQVIYCELAGEQARLYKEIEERTRKEIFEMEMAGASEGKVRFAALQQLLRLRQVCAEPRVLKDTLKSAASAKSQALLELLEEASDGDHRVLVFSQFTSVLKILAGDLEAAGLSFCYLDGQTKNRQAVVDQFNDDKNIPVFLISLKAGGTGLNLTGADTVVHFDPWWNPAAEAQATDRAHRIGQSRTVTSLKLIAANTVEDRVLSMQREKASLLESLFEESDAATATVGLADIKGLLGG